MATIYPAQIDTPTSLPDVIDNVSGINAASVNIVKTAVVAVETVLGPMPQGLYTTVRKRIDAVEALIQSAIVGDFSPSGDLSGNQVHQTVIGLQTRPISSSVPAIGSLLWFDGITWQYGVPAGDLSFSSPNVRVAKIQGNAVKNQVLGATQDGYVLTWINASSDWEATPSSNAITLFGDVTGSGAANTVVKIRNNLVTAQTLNSATDGYVLTWDNTDGYWKALPSNDAIALLGDVTGTANANTVVKLRNHSVASQTLNTTTDGYVLTWDNSDGYWKAEPSSVSSSGITPGTAGQIFVTNATPASTWTSLINYETTHGRFTAGGGGADTSSTIGPLVSAETAFAALYLLPNATSPGANNWTILGSTNVTDIGFPSGGILRISVPGVGDFVTYTTAGGMTWYNTSAQGIANIEPVHGRATLGGGGTDTLAVIGPDPVSPALYADLHLLANAATASGTNYTLRADGSSIVHFNVPAAGGSIYFEFGASVFASLIKNSTAGLLILGNVIPSLSNYALFGDGGTQVNLNAPTTTSFIEFSFGGSIATLEMFAGTQGGLATGTVIASQGHFRTTKAFNWYSRNSLNTGDDQLFQLDGSDNFTIAGSGVSALTFGSTSTINILSASYIAIESATIYSDASTFVWRDAGHAECGRWTLANASGLVLSAEEHTPLQLGITGATTDHATVGFTLKGQDAWASGVTFVNGGVINIISGAATTSGVNAPGSIFLKLGSKGAVVSDGFYFTAIGAANPIAAFGYWDAPSDTLGSLWFGTAATPGNQLQTNYAFLGDGALYTIINAPTSGTLYLRVGNAATVADAQCVLNSTNFYVAGTGATALYSFDISTSAALHFQNSATTAKIKYDAQTSDVATAALTIQGQYAFATATLTNRIPGSIVFDIGAPTNGLTGLANEGAFKWSRNGTVLQTLAFDGTNSIATWTLPNTSWEWEWVVGGGEIVLASNVFAAGGASAWWISASSTTTYMGAFLSAAAPLIFDYTTSTTPTIRSGTSATQLTLGTNNSGATLFLQAGAASSALTLTNTDGYFGGTTLSSPVRINWETSSTPLIQFAEASTSATINIIPRSSDNPTHNLTIQGQYPFATATLGNRIPGNVVFDIGLPTNGGTTEGYFSYTRNAIEGARIGRSASGQFSLWLGQSAAFTGSNMAVISDASTFTYLNTNTGGAVGVVTADATFLLYIPTTQDHLYFLGTTTASPWYLDCSTTTTPVINSGTGATSLTVSTNKSGASLVLKADSAVTLATFTGTTSSIGVSTGTNTLTGSLIETTRSSSSSFTLDNTTNDRQIFITATQTLTLDAAAHTNGRRNTIWIDTTSTGSNGSDITLTIAPASTEKINGTNANWIITVPGSPKQMVQLDMIGDGTNIRIVG